MNRTALPVSTAVAIGLTLALVGCGETSTGTVQLTDQTLWQPVSADADPFVELVDPDQRVDCTRDAWQIEEVGGTGLEVRTENCNFATFSQPLAAGIRPGDQITIRVLTTPFFITANPLPAYVALSLNGTVIWQRDLQVPSEAELLDETFESTVKAPAGNPILYHVNNHGNNSWTVYEISRRR